VGLVRIVDRDFLELNNLQRQVLFDERDLADELPKAVAAARKLSAINSQVVVEPVVADVSFRNIGELAGDVGAIIDGTDNFETRMLVNDYCVSRDLPWVYGGCIGAEGQTMSILPGQTACLRCLMPETPPPGATPTCDTAGILAPIAGIVACWQSSEAIKILGGNLDAVSRTLTIIELWENRVRQVRLDPAEVRPTCRCCTGREFPWLEGRRGGQSAVLCGRNAVQLSPDTPLELSLGSLAERLSAAGHVTHNRYLLRLAVEPYQLTVFPDGRAIVGGTDDLAVARTVYAKYVGA
jgi:adenylyltransferase/sulfurtransferase